MTRPTPRRAAARPRSPRGAPSGVLGLALAAALASCGSEPAGGARGVLLISVDSLRADHLSSYGYESPTAPGIPTTPIVDRMVASEGALFTAAYSTTSWTLPSHMAMLTGLPNELHGVRGLPDQLHPEKPLLAQLFTDAGWRTAGFWSGPNLHPFFGFDRGFELYEDCSAYKIKSTAVFQPNTEEEFLETVEMHEGSHEGVTGPALVDGFSRWFQGIGDDEKFFAFVHMWDVHYDYEAPREHDLFHPGPYTGKIDGLGFTELELKSPRTPKGLADLYRLISLYDAEIHYTDANVGKMLNLLSRAGRLNDTLVVFTSDHGEEFLEHQALGHKHSLFEETVRIPLLMRLPDVIPRGTVVDELVSLTDLAPTILELCGLDVPASIWGESLVGTFDGGSLPERMLPLELSFKPAPQIWRATHDGRFKVNDIPGREKSYRDNLFVFDLKTDPYEADGKQVLRAEPTDQVSEALGFLAEIDALAAELPMVNPDRMPTELEQALGDAGYMGDDPTEGLPEDDPKDEGSQ